MRLWINKSSLLVVIVNAMGLHATYAQQATLSWKLHNVAKVRQVFTNVGALNAVNDGMFSYPGLINCEYPAGSFEEHLASGGIWIGATVGRDTLVSVTEGEGSSREFFPSSAPWDSTWVVARGDTVQIPYWGNYVGVSDQDFVCRYTDYGPTSLRVANHVPLYLDVIQTSYAWGSPPLDEIIVFNYYVLPTRITLENVYLTSWINGNVGNATIGDYALDDESFFRRDRMIAMCVDVPGGVDGDAYGPLGDKVFPPTAHRASDSLRLTYQWYNGRQQGLPSRDNERYQQMTNGVIMQNQQSTGDGTKAQVSFGPYRLQVGDTLHLVRVLVLGRGLQGVYRNADYVDILIRKNFRVPSPPPSPPLRVETLNHQVRLRWNPRPGDVNPENYYDPYRADSVTKPFEGYRVYKSTRSATGPWTLLAEFDDSTDAFGQNTGLAYEYTDLGLLNNLDYFYTVTTFSKPDTITGFPSQESSRNAVAHLAVPGPKPPQNVGQVAAVPNPYRGDIAYYSYNPPWEKPAGQRERWMEQDRRIQFINLPEQCEIRIYSIAGDLVATIQHSDPTKGYEDWNLTSSVGQAISSGLYLFTAEDQRTSQVQVGKFVIIK